MVETSNNFIAGLLVVAIVISLYSFLTIANFGGIRVTGGASTGTGSANVTISSSTDIILLRSKADFDSGYTSGAALTLTTQQQNTNTFDSGSEGNGTNYSGCDGTEAACAFPFVVKNEGNINVSINISSASEAATWVGAGASSYFKGKSNQSGSCGLNFTGGGGFGDASAWQSLNITQRVVCSNLSSADTIDEIRVHFNLTIPTTATTGAHGVVVTVGALAG